MKARMPGEYPRGMVTSRSIVRIAALSLLYILLIACAGYFLLAHNERFLWSILCGLLLAVVLQTWIWPSRVFVPHMLENGDIAIERIRNHASGEKSDTIDLTSLVAVEVLRRATVLPDWPKFEITAGAIRLFFDSRNRPYLWDLTFVFHARVLPSKAELSIFKAWEDLSRRLTEAADANLAERWSRLNAVGRLHLLILLSECACLRRSPSTLRMLLASFVQLPDLISYASRVLKQAFSTFRRWVLFLVLAILSLRALWVILANPSVHDVGNNSFDYWSGVLLPLVLAAPLVLCFLVAIINQFKPLSEQYEILERGIASRLMRVVQAEELDPILKFTEDKLDRLRAILDRLSVITVLVGLLPYLQPQSHDKPQYYAFFAGLVVVILQTYRAVQSNILRVTKTACLFAQSILRDNTEKDWFWHYRRISRDQIHEV
jgi:hypothetical protein